MAETRKRRMPQHENKDKQRDKRRKEESRIGRTLENETKDKEKNKERMAETRKRRMPQHENKDKQRDKRRKEESRIGRTLENENNDKEKNKERMAETRKRRMPQQENKDKQTDKRRKEECRKSRTPEHENKDKQTDKTRKEKCRKSRTPEHENKDKQTDKTRKEECRKSRTPEHENKDKQTDKTRKEKCRKSRTPEHENKDKQTDKTRKEECRKSRTPEHENKDKQTDKTRKVECRKSRTPEHESKDKQVDQRRKVKARHPDDGTSANKLFMQHINNSPEYVCTVCHRTLYRNSVVLFHKMSDFAKTFIDYEISPDKKTYICNTCKRYLNKHKIPPQAQANNMSIPETPNVLTSLTDFEARLLAKRYPFMKIVSLPKGQQRGIHGRVVNVPVDAEQLCNSLPRTLSTSGIVAVKLKRKQTYKGHVTYQNIRPHKIRDALLWLKKHNRHYQHVVDCDQWEQKCEQENTDLWKHLTKDQPTVEKDQGNSNHEISEPLTSNNTVSSDEENSEEENNETNCDESHAQPTEFDTCIQTTDPAIDAANVLSLAPGEGKRPLHIMMDPGCEEQSFPHLFPTGCFGFDAERTVSLTPKKYFNARILNKNGTFAKNVEYLFYAQYITEHKQVMDSVNIAVRKSYQSRPSGESLHAGYVKDPDRLKSLIFKDKAYRFLQTVRGSPPYWQQAMYKLMAAVKQFGMFTFFVTLSAADLKWTDTLNAILRQQGKHLSSNEIEELTWSDKCQLLRSNPVTAARHFNHRLQTIFSDIILGPSEPLGKVSHYSYRIEFQQRGSPHAHCVLWIENAPTPNDSDKVITDFINKFITCHIPSETEDPELFTLVTSLQKHNHTATCRKKGTECRFHYPKLPSTDTMIAKPIESDDVVFKTATQEAATDILTAVNTTLDNDKDQTITDLQDVLKSSNVTMEQYKYALGITRRGKTVILERDPSERFINGYNSDLLRAWQANLDVQYCLDPYACIAYMVAYITKDEREMSTVLQNMAKEMQHQDWKEQMKACASAFLNAREVSAQEAVYRLLSFPLFKSNFTTVFVPADLPEKRVKLLKPNSVLQSMEDEEEDIFAVNILDRYASRPELLRDMCLAEFAVSYTISSANSTCNDNSDDDQQHEQTTDIIYLKNGLGIMKKKAKKSVLRYQRKSKAKQPDEYYYSHLLLFLCWKDEHSELLTLPSYEEHYNTNIETIELNRSQLEHHADVIQLAVEQFESFGPPVHAFDEIAPQAQQQNECDLIEQDEDDPALAILHPNEDVQQQMVTFELPVSNTVSASIEIRPGILSQNDYCKHVRSLNNEQRDIFQQILNWCKQKSLLHKTAINPPQVCVFISGGAGTGKSHLISAIYQMSLRTLQREGENPDDIKVVLAAPTGTAAHNISGTTLHSAFLLPLGQTGSYVKLSDDKRNSLRVKAANLEVLIIDEISMVGSNLLLQLHYRLCEIKSSQQPFGGISVLAFGDMYQLPPVKQQFIFKPVSDIVARLYGPLWDNFQYTELTQIMRQRDDLTFAEMLNRIRTQSHSENDVQQLRAREVSGEYPEHALHVFSTNRNVDHHNQTKLNELEISVEVLVAIDKKPKCLSNYKQNDTKFTGGLPNEIQLAKGARVMLIRNLDIGDGLVNGAQGTVIGFIKSNHATPSTIVAVLVKFDLPNTGTNTRQKSRFPSELNAYPDATPILRSEVSFTVNEKNKNLTISRYQFPLKLSWACTIHKVQGLTVGEIVVSFDNHFSSGQAYVALSRATSIQGLHILNFEPKKIKSSIPVKNEMERLEKSKSVTPYYQFLQTSTENLNLSVLNIRSYNHNKDDLLADPIFNNSDIIILTETWLSHHNQQVGIFPITHSVHRADRPIHGTSTRHSGGVAVVLKSDLHAEKMLDYTDQYLQIVAIRVACDSGKIIYIVGVYNSPDHRNNSEHCGSEIINILQRMYGGNSSPVIIAGDFNQNISDNQFSDVQNVLLSRNFVQHILEPTHDAGSCIDHLYTHDLDVLQSRVANCYYSDHKWLWATVAKNFSQ